MSTRQNDRKGHQWVPAIGLDLTAHSAHSLRRTKATLIYKRTRNLGAIQLLLGHSTRKHRSISRNRGRRCARDLRSNRDLNIRRDRTTGCLALQPHSRWGTAPLGQFLPLA
ncbi:hypothetical protein [Caballeronia calidae]|uniref:hypothetical protein n=1 Tax=Caballeronia calidae TaxID=1777139 RepID=UPI0035B53649